MKLLIVLCALTAFVSARPDDHYSERYDNFDIEELIKNKRLLISHAECFEGEGKCTPEASELKELAPEAVQTSCGKCTEKQKVLVAKVMKAVKETLPEHWEKLRHKYDAEGKFENDFKAFVEKYAA
ncbi:allergen Tha p 1-like [Zerene cesonia]|uniref:allergen Tha p 1-like n=1 Tax=Zerene cesonia TaxID=33412 RepID=UPI0018E55024|nr:allergen Tha p 1-like [Zerene cesonia]